MSEKPKSSTETGQQLNAVMTGMRAGMLAANELLTDSVVGGMRKTEVLNPARSDGFGTFAKKYRYTEGCVISSEFVKDVAEVSFKTKTPDGVRRVVGIGATPMEWDPATGGKAIAEAGEPGALLMVVVKTEADGSTGTSYRYLDSIDVEGVRVVIGESTMLGENQDRARQIQVPGEVTEVAGFIAQ